MFKSILYCVIFSVITQASCFAVDVVCDVTPQIWGLEPPPSDIGKTNNLRIETGGVYFSSGRFINIYGRLLDARCVPVGGARLVIWHAPPPKGVLKRDGNFLGSGTAITDNLGYFTFLTVMPGASAGPVPYINFRIEHRDSLPFETKMFFPQRNNKSDNDFKALKNNAERNLLIAKRIERKLGTIKDGCENEEEEEWNYNFVITLGQRTLYKRYN